MRHLPVRDTSPGSGQARARPAAPVRVPIRWSRLLLGFLWLIEPAASLGQEEISQAVTAAEAAGMVLYRRMLLHEHERGRQEALLRDLVSADPAARARAQDEIADSGPMAATGHVALESVDIVSPSEGSAPTDAQAALSAAVEEACRAEPAGRTLVQAQPRRALLLYAAPCSPEAVQERLAALAHRVLRVLSSSSNGVFRAVAGVGSVQASLGCGMPWIQEPGTSSRPAAESGEMPMNGPPPWWMPRMRQLPTPRRTATRGGRGAAPLASLG